MKFTSIVAVAGIGILSACSESPVDPSSLTPSNSNNAEQQSVTGHVEPHLRSATVEEYSFSAITTPQGDVEGRFEVHDANPNGTTDRVTGRVLCFTILPDGKTARVGGVIESSTNAFVPPGLEAVWTVRDSGEGHDVQDGATDLSWGYPPGSALQHCATGLRFYKQPFTLSERGNIQVRP